MDVTLKVIMKMVRAVLPALLVQAYKQTLIIQNTVLVLLVKH